MTDQLTRRLLNKRLGLDPRVRLALWPATTGVPATGAALLVGAGIWGGYVDIVGAAAIGVPFWLTQLQYDTIDVVQIFDVEIRNTTLTTTLIQTKVDPTGVSPNISPVDLPFFIYCAPDTRVQGRAGGAAAKTIHVSLLVATGL